MIFKNKKRGKRRRRIKSKNKSVKGFLILISVLFILVLMVESAQIFLPFFKESTKEKEVVNIQRPVYIVDSQPIDLDAYLRQYFANKVPQETMYVTVSAYSSTKDQTDGTPFFTSLGTPVREGIVAANFLPVGTVVRFPDKFEDKLFVVEDHMDERFGLQVDIWMSNQEEAKKFGIQYLKMEVF